MPKFDLDELLGDFEEDATMDTIPESGADVPRSLLESYPVQESPSPALGRTMVKASLSTPTNLHRERISAPFSQERTRRVRSLHLSTGKGPLWAQAGLSVKKSGVQHDLPVQQRERPDPVLPTYPSEPAVPLDCKEKWRNDMGLFMGRSFRVCFSPSGKIYMPAQCFGADAASRVGGAQQVLVKPVAGRLFEEKSRLFSSDSSKRSVGSTLRREESAPLPVRELKMDSLLRREESDPSPVRELSADSSRRRVGSITSAGTGNGGYATLLQVHHELSQSRDDNAVMQGLERYCNAAELLRGSVGGFAASVFTCVRALQQSSPQALLTSFSAWLQRDLEGTVRQALAARAADGSALSSYDKIFIHLTGRQIDEACAIAQNECRDFALAVLLAQAGEDTSLPEDMQAQVFWLESQYANQMVDEESAKLLQIYRLLAGQVDQVLEHISADFKEDSRTRQGGRRLVGGQLLDWRRCLALFLWYAAPAEHEDSLTRFAGEMGASPADLFADTRRLHLSLQGAIQYYLGKCWEARGKPERNGVQIVPHPWPAYVEDSTNTCGLPLHLLRKLVQGGPENACVRMTPCVRARLGWTIMEKPCLPGAGILRTPAGSADPAPAGLNKEAHEFWEGWAVDVRLELASLLFPMSNDAEVSLAHLLETESNSLLGLDTELSWHLHEVLVRLARLGEMGAERAGMLAARLRACTDQAGQLLSQHQRALLTHHYATQLEMSGDWQAAAYVLLSSANVDKPFASDAEAHDARMQIALALRALLARHATRVEKREPVIHVANVCTITIDSIAERLHLGRELVLNWFLQAQAWALRAPAAAGAQHSFLSRTVVRRMRVDEELDLCIRCGEWLRANQLLLELISPADLPDPSSHGAAAPKHTVEMLRKVHTGLCSFRRSHDWNVHRSLDLWSQGCWAILTLLEVLDTFERLSDDRLHELPSLMAKVKDAGEILRILPPGTQRAVDHLYTKVAVSLWQCTQVPGELGIHLSTGQDAAHVVTLNQLPVAPSKQLHLLQKLVVASLEQCAQNGSGPHSAGAHDDTAWLDNDRETEMC